ncbi:MAG: hypothetical protein O7G87_09410, partial [bacterium]|nr:hypothetical protein [bacterium]
GCERCHGPGEHHVNLHEQGLESEPIDRTIVNPEHVPANQKIDICLQCHLQGTMRVLKKDHTETDFRPGQSLTALKSIFIQAGLPPGDFGIASHGERFLSSVCYQKSRMGCTYCHDPHRPVQTVSRSFFNGRCTTCHETLSPATQTGHHRPGADCVACHMRQGATADILHVNFTDHWIRKKFWNAPKAS